jgi:beta-xylosidase
MNSVENRVIRGFNPDPSIVRTGENLYIAARTFVSGVHGLASL